MNQRTAYRLLSPLWRRLRLLISRGVVRRSAAGRGMQRLQLDLLRGEAREVEHMEPYGYTSRPLNGAEVVGAAVGGARGHFLALVASDRRHRRRGLEQGEVCLYTDEGDEIHMRRGRVIAVTAGSRVHVTAPEVRADCDTAEVNASTSVTLDTPQTLITGDLTVQGLITGQGGLAISGGHGASVDGDLDTTGDVTAGGISLQGHVHGGVQSGGSTTGAAQ